MKMKDVIKARCKELGIGPVDLMHRIHEAGHEGVSYHTAYSWYLGYKHPRHEVVPSLAEALGLTIDELYGVTSVVSR